MIPLFLTIRTQEQFGLVTDEHVTQDDPQKLLLKTDILDDVEKYGDTSDFYNVRKYIMDYPEEDMLIVYDPEFKYGQNFVIAVSVEAKFLISKVMMMMMMTMLELMMMMIMMHYEPPEPREWVSLGSEKEINMWAVHAHRSKVNILLKRKWSFFGLGYNFTDVDAFEDRTNCVDIIHDYPSSHPSKPSIHPSEPSVHQAVPEVCSREVDRMIGLSKNAIVQCQARELTVEEIEEHLSSARMKEFLHEAIPKVNRVIQQNKTLDMFYDDWKQLNVSYSVISGKSDKQLKEYQSYTDLQHGKTRTVSCIAWHPRLAGIVAVSIIDSLSLYDRVDQATKFMSNPNLILIWGLDDQMHPLLILESPDQILCFQFNPTNDNWIAGGCFNGMVVLWDISYHQEKLAISRAGAKKNVLQLSTDFDKSKVTETVRYCAVSSIEHSHSLPITDIIWLPRYHHVSKFGYLSENKTEQCVQLLTCSPDQSILFWDIRTHKERIPQENKSSCHTLTPSTFKHLDYVWRPLLKVSTIKNETGADFAPVKFSISPDNYQRPVTADATGVNQGNPELNISTKFYVGTEDGEVLYLDWSPTKDQESGKYQTQKPMFAFQIHDGPVVSLTRSPFFPRVVLSVGGLLFALWRENVNTGPIFVSGSSAKYLNGGMWSGTKPAVFFLIRIDGVIEIWDMLASTHEPSWIQSISGSSLTSICILAKSARLLALGDSNGTLHLLELPPIFYIPKSNETEKFGAYLESETKRREYVEARWAMRDEERVQMDIAAKILSKPVPQLTEDELEARDRLEYEKYLEEEIQFLKELGMYEEEVVATAAVRPASLGGGGTAEKLNTSMAVS
uniref:WD repeat-containing protein 63 n=1 Tax=Helobdella robusta TaxID=6412 RepID=T1G3K0_HELRO